MRKHIILLTFSVLLLMNVLWASVDVNIPNNLTRNQAVLPDMSGLYHLTPAEGSRTTPFYPVENDRELPSVLPGFPLSYSNANTYNGAVYCNMDEDPEMEVLFGVGKKIVAFNYDGSLVSGWPVTLTFYIWGSPAVGDIDGDGIEEIVCTSRNNTNGNTGALFAFHKDGSAVTGFPVTQTGGGTMNVCLADLNNDETLEILVNIRNSPNGWVYAYNGSGQVVEGWPQQLNTFPGAGISAGDLDNDGDVEVVALSYTSLYVYHSDGTIVSGFPLSLDAYTVSYSSPVLFDLDNDGVKEIIFGACGESNGAVFVVKFDGTVMTGWPQTTGSWIFATVSLGDINADGMIDLLVGDQTSSAEPANFIYAWDKNGVALTGFPAGPFNAIYGQSAIADIDGDQEVEIVFTSNLFGEGFNAINHDGTHLNGWPLSVGTDATAVTMMSSAVIGDFNGDGYLNIAGASTGFSSWLVEMYLWNTDISYNPSLNYTSINGCNIRHDGVFEYENVNPVLNPPNNLTFTIDENNVTLNWELPDISSSTLTGFNVYRNDTLLTQNLLDSATLSYSDMNLDNGQYNYQVTAVYTEGESAPASVTVTISVGGGTITTFPWNEDFEGASFAPAYWTNIDQDGDNNFWFAYSAAGAPHGGIKCAGSASWTSTGGALNPDNWLITPKLELPTYSANQTAYLRFWIAAQDPDWPEEHYSVLISTTNTDIASFTPVLSETLTSGDWIQRSVALNSYSNQDIYVAFRHHEVTDMFYIKLDDILVELGQDATTPVAKQTKLGKNYPNPFNPSTSIAYSLKERTQVSVEVFNIKGQKVRTLVNEVMNAGDHTIVWNGKDSNNNDAGSGVYFYRMTTANYSSTGKMILVK